MHSTIYQNKKRHAKSRGINVVNTTVHLHHHHHHHRELLHSSHLSSSSPVWEGFPSCGYGSCLSAPVSPFSARLRGRGRGSGLAALNEEVGLLGRVRVEGVYGDCCGKSAPIEIVTVAQRQDALFYISLSISISLTSPIFVGGRKNI